MLLLILLDFTYGLSFSINMETRDQIYWNYFTHNTVCLRWCQGQVAQAAWSLNLAFPPLAASSGIDECSKDPNANPPALEVQDG